MIIKNPLTINIVKVEGDTKIVVPDAFANATKIYTFKLNDTEYLISSDVTNSGLWKYSITSKTSSQLYSSGNDFAFFQETQNGVLFSSNNSNCTGLFYYKKTDNSVIKKYASSYYWNNFTPINPNGDFLIGASTSNSIGFLKFDNDTEEVLKVSGANSNFYGLKKYDDYTIIAVASNSSSASGLWKYDETSNSFIKFAGTSSYSYISATCKNNNDYTIFYTSREQQTYLWDNINKTLSQIEYISGLIDSNVNPVFKFGDYIIILPPTPSKKVYEIDLTDFSITDLYAVDTTNNTAMYWKYIIIENDLIAVPNSSYWGGVIFYDSTTNTISNILSNSSSAIGFSNIVNNKIIIYGVTSGVYLYDIITKQVTQIYTTGLWARAIESNNYIIFYGTSSSTTGLLLYKFSTETFQEILTTGYDYTYNTIVGNDCLISASSSSYPGLWLFNGDTFTLNKVMAISGAYAFTYELDGNNCYIKNGHYPFNNKYVFYYNSSNKIFKLLYYIV